MVGVHKSNWHQTLFSTLWDYRTSVKTTIGFMPFQLIYGLEAILPIQCQIPSLQLVIELLLDTSIEEERFLYLNNLDETQRYFSLANDAHKKHVKVQYDKSIQPRVFIEGDLVLTYDKRYDKLGKGKFESMWYGPFIISKVLEKGAYELVDYDGIPLGQPRNGLYLKGTMPRSFLDSILYICILIDIQCAFSIFKMVFEFRVCIYLYHVLVM